MTDVEVDGSVVVSVPSQSGLSILRSLGGRGIHTIAVLEDRRAPAFRSRYCDERVVTPSPATDLLGYRDALLSLARRDAVRAVVPARDQDAYVLSRYRDRFADHVTPVWPDLETLRSAQDRLRLVRAADDAGVPVPETHLLTEVEDWSGRWIVKPRFSVLGDAYHDLTPQDECVEPPTTRYVPRDRAPDVEGLRAEMGHVPIAQEFVPTADEYVFDAIYDRGECLATFQHRQVRPNEYHGGASVCRVSVDRPRLDELGRGLLDALGWHGVACVEFMEHADTGELVLTEINPRFWASLPLTVRAGADFPWYYWALSNGRPDAIEPGYRTGVVSHYLRGELHYLRSVLREDYPLVDRPSRASAVAEVARSLVAHPHFDTFQVRDPGPFVREAANYLLPRRDPT